MPVTASVIVALFTIQRHGMINHNGTAITSVRHLMDIFSLAEGIGKTSRRTLQWYQPNEKGEQNSQ